VERSLGHFEIFKWNYSDFQGKNFTLTQDKGYAEKTNCNSVW